MQKTILAFLCTLLAISGYAQAVKTVQGNFNCTSTGTSTLSAGVNLFTGRDEVTLKTGTSLSVKGCGERSISIKLDPNIVTNITTSTGSGASPADDHYSPITASNSYTAPTLVGAIPGSGGVSGSGAATYTIPIDFPTGPNGIKPSMSFSYNSQAKKGLLGWGWELTGVSSIYREKQSWWIDKTVVGIAMKNNDRLAWDGNRLVLNSGNYGADGSTYRTYNETFWDITCSTTGDTIINGFTATNKRGESKSYGGGNANAQTWFGASSGTTYGWNITQYKDPNGNTIDYAYMQKIGDSRLTEISYSGGNSSTPFCKVRFLYGTKYLRDKWAHYGPAVLAGRAGETANFDNLLLGVEVLVNGSLYKKYTLNYELTNGCEKLNTVIQTNYDGSKLNPTLIYWNTTAQNGITEENVNNASPNFTFNNVEKVISCNLNKDELPDMVVLDSDIWQFWLNRGNGKYEKVPNSDVPKYGSTTINGTVTILDQLLDFFVIDDNMDGVDELYGLTADFTRYYAKVYKVYSLNAAGTAMYLNKTSFINLDSWPDINAIGNNKLISGDFNGDGITDIIELSNSKIVNASSSLPLNLPITVTLTGTGVRSATAAASWGKAIDIDRDGVDELIIQQNTNNIVDYSYNAGTKTFDPPNTSYYRKWDDPIAYPNFVDIDGDGSLEVLGIQDTDPSSNGDGYLWWFNVVFPYDGSNSTYEKPLRDFYEDFTHVYTYADYLNICKFRTADINNDGKDDIVRLIKILFGHYVLSVGISSGSGSFQRYDYDIVLTGATPDTDIPDENIIVKDMNGDGTAEIFLMSNKGHARTLYFNKDVQDRLVGSITDGMGNSTSYSYQPLNSSNYTPSANTAAFPIKPLYGGMVVATSVKVPDGIGGISETTYSYAGAQRDLQGKGFLGFETTIAKNATTDSWVERNYGVFAQSTSGYDFVLQSVSNKNFAGTELGRSDYTYDYHLYDKGSKLVYPKQVLSSNKILNTMVSESTLYTNFTFGEPEWNKKEYYTITAPASGSTTPTSTMDGYEYVQTFYKDLNADLRGLDYQIASKKIGTSDPYSAKTSYEYDAAHGYKLNKVHNYSGTTKQVNTTIQSWDAFGNPTQITVAAVGVPTKTTQYGYSASGRFLVSQTDFEGNTASYTYNEVAGLPVQKTEQGLVTSYTAYDGLGRLLIARDYLGNVTKTSYDWAKNGRTLYSISSQTDGSAKTTTQYDLVGRVIYAESDVFAGANNPQKMASSTSYKADGTVDYSYKPYLVSGGPSKKVSYTYMPDGSHRVYSVKDELNNITTTYGYDGTKTTVSMATPSEGMRTSSQTVNAMGLTTSATDLTGNTQTYSYHSSGQVTAMNANSNSVVTSFDLVNATPISVNDPSLGLINNGVDLYGRVANLDLPSNANTPAAPGTASPRLSLLNYAYDGASGRISLMYSSDNSVKIAYTYNDHTTGAKSGKPSTMNYPNADYDTQQSIAISYDDMGRPTNTSRNVKTPAMSKYLNINTALTYGPEGNGKPTKKSFASGFAINYKYDNITGELYRIENAVDNSPIWELTSIAGNGKPSAMKYGTKAVATLSYDNADNQTNYKLVLNGNTYNYNTSFDSYTGKLMSRSNFASSNAITETFGYDKDRLTTINSVSNATYSSNGNIAIKTDAGGYTYDASNPYAISQVSLSTTTSAIAFRQQDIQYNNYFNKATSISENGTTATITYGPDQQRLGMSIGNVNYIYGDDYEAQVDGNGNILKEWTYIHGPYGLVAVRINIAGTKTLYYAHTDHLGSVMMLSDVNGNVVERYNFDAWGRRRDPSTLAYLSTFTGLMRRGYTGHEHLDEFGLINMNGRLYDPVVGRMLSADPVLQAPGNSQSFNRYSYVMNNPLSYTDPSGYVFGGSSPGYDDWMNNLMKESNSSYADALNGCGSCGSYSSQAFNSIRQGSQIIDFSFGSNRAWDEANADRQSQNTNPLFWYAVNNAVRYGNNTNFSFSKGTFSYSYTTYGVKGVAYVSNLTDNRIAGGYTSFETQNVVNINARGNLYSAIDRTLNVAEALMNRSGIIATGLSLIESNAKSAIISNYQRGGSIVQAISDYKGVAKIGGFVQKLGFVGLGISTAHLGLKMYNGQANTSDYLRFGISAGMAFVTFTNPIGIIGLGVYGVVDTLYGNDIWKSTGIDE